MILTRNEILREIKLGNIKLKPFKKNNVGPASVDLTLSNEFRLFKYNQPVTLNENSDYKMHTTLLRKKSIVIFPNEYILGITKEVIKLPESICGWISGRSRFARFGLSIHITASFIQPGINNKQVLEIKNLSSMPLILKEGLKIGQLILERTEGTAKYSGKFKTQYKL